MPFSWQNPSILLLPIAGSRRIEFDPFDRKSLDQTVPSSIFNGLSSWGWVSLAAIYVFFVFWKLGS